MAESAIPADIAKLSFEDALTELEEIVRSLESGKGKLDEAIKSYERGAALKRHCERKLRRGAGQDRENRLGRRRRGQERTREYRLRWRTAVGRTERSHDRVRRLAGDRCSIALLPMRDGARGPRVRGDALFDAGRRQAAAARSW